MSPQTVTYQWMVRGMVRILAGIGVLLGSAMVVGGPERFASPGFATARLVPGGVYTWGISLAVAGVVSATGILFAWRHELVVAGLYLQAVWFLFFAIGLSITTLHTPQGAVTGPVAYGGMALLCLVGAVGGRDLPGGRALQR